MSDLPGLLHCQDFMQFQKTLKQMRLIDDKIVYALNNSIPTASFEGKLSAAVKCKELHGQIAVSYGGREKAINRCIEESAEDVEAAKSSGDSAALRNAHLRLRLYRNELSVEEVVRKRTHDIFHEKCRDHYRPS